MQKFDNASSIVVAAIEGKSLSSDEISFFKEYQPAGLTIFERNITYPIEKTRALLQEIQELNKASYPMIVAIDQEGGRVRRFKDGFPDERAMRDLLAGRTDEEALEEIEAYAANIGALLLDAGVNVNFAPCVDVLTVESNKAIGDRAFSTEPEEVSLRAGAFLRGMQSVGLLGCLKHFPGQGGAGVDTHKGPATIHQTLDQLEDCELIPYRALAKEVEMVMVAHCEYPAFENKPASLSPKVMSFLRQSVGFSGIIVSDDMLMGAIDQSEEGWSQALIDCVYAGADLLLVCRGLDRCKLAVEALRREAKANEVFAARLEASATKVHAMRAHLSLTSKLA